MENKYNLNYFETMNNAYEYLDTMEDNMNFLYNNLEPDQLDNALEAMKNDHESLLYLEDQLNMFLENGDYQNACNQLVVTEMFHMLIRDVLPEWDASYIADYLESISEMQLIEDVTRIIDKYNK